MILARPMPKELVKIGKKPVERYREALIFSIDEYGECRIRALGRRERKAEELAKYAKGFDGLEIESKEIIRVGETPGVEIKVVVADDED